jgi:hypothetical protein
MADMRAKGMDEDELDICPVCGGWLVWVGDVWVCLFNFCNLVNAYAYQRA